MARLADRSCGQLGHFKVYAKDKIPYAIDRFSNEVHRLYGVLESQLARQGDWVAGDYSIADIAIFPWLRLHERWEIDLKEFPHTDAWLRRIAERPAVVRGLDAGSELETGPANLDDEARKHLFSQRARSK